MRTWQVGTVRRPSKAQVTALAWAIHRFGGFGRSTDCDFLDIRDKTVAALESAGWVDRVKFYDDALRWRWWWFYVTDSARTLPDVIAEVAKLKSYDDVAAKASITADDESCYANVAPG